MGNVREEVSSSSCSRCRRHLRGRAKTAGDPNENASQRHERCIGKVKSAFCCYGPGKYSEPNYYCFNRRVVELRAPEYFPFSL